MESSPADPEKLRLIMIGLLDHSTTFDGSVFRSATPAYAREADLLTGAGSAKFGGRWNPTGVAAVYLSLTPETAMAETLAHYRYSGIGVENAMPRVFVSVSVFLHTVLDLRLGIVRRKLRISQERMMDEDWRKSNQNGETSLTQRIGHAALSAGYEGLLVHSAADPHGANLVVFPANIQEVSRMTVLNADHLTIGSGKIA